MKQAGEDTADDLMEEDWTRIDAIIKSYAGKPGSLIPVLEEVQNINGFLPESVQRRVAKGLGLPLSQVYGVVTFYSFFTMKPRGKNQVRVCLGTACHVRGATRNLEKLKQNLGIEVDECTDDRLFGLEVVRCLGACGLAPVMVVGDETHRHVKDIELDQILNAIRNKQEEPGS